MRQKNKRTEIILFLFTAAFIGFGVSDSTGLADTISERADVTVGSTQPLYDDEWASWIAGDWVGIVKTKNGQGWQRQSFSFEVDGRYILTRMHREIPGTPAYRGIGIFRYDTQGAYGLWAGLLDDMNDGVATRDYNRMIWSIERSGTIVTRIRERLSNDRFRVVSTWMDKDGETERTIEEMRRL